jgi:hypothetical protein
VNIISLQCRQLDFGQLHVMMMMTSTSLILARAILHLTTKSVYKLLLSLDSVIVHLVSRAACGLIKPY